MICTGYMEEEKTGGDDTDVEYYGEDGEKGAVNSNKIASKTRSNTLYI